MQGPLAEVSAKPADPSPGALGHRAARGFASTLVSTLIVKGIMFAGQVVLAWYLSKREFGLAGTALAASIFPALLKEFGVTQMLLRHPRRYAHWSADAAWLTTALGFLAAITMILVTPMVAWISRSPEVIGPLMILAVNAAIAGATAVPSVKLQIDLRFVFIARLATISSLITTLIAVGMAMAGFGPYAIVMPVLVNSILHMFVTFWLVPVRWLRWPQWTRCRVMLADGWKILASMFFFQIVWQFDRLILGALHTQEQVGIYYLAFQLSSQTLTLLSFSLAQVLLPVLGHMSGDWQRQRDGFLRACRFLCAVGIPLCFIQAGVASPLVRLIWRDRWVDAIPALQALSIGSAFRLLGVMGANLLLAQGRLDTYLRCAIVSSIVFLAMVTGAAWIGGATSVAITVAAFYSVMETAIAVIAVGGADRGASPSYHAMLRTGTLSVASVLRAPLAIGLLGGATGYLSSEWALSRFGALAGTAIGTSAGLIVCAAAMAVLSRDLVNELTSLFRSIGERSTAEA